MSFCQKCGKEQVSGAQFCNGCGTALGVAGNGAGDGADTGAGTSAPKKKAWIYIVDAVLAVVVVGSIAYRIVDFCFIPRPVSAKERAMRAVEDSLRLVSENATKVGATTEDTPIEFVVNIAGTDDRFLKAAVIFEYDEKNEKLGAELRKKAPTKYKDMLINHMSSLSFTEVTDPSERDKICHDLRRMINASLPAKMGEVRSVLFTTYITQ